MLTPEQAVAAYQAATNHVDDASAGLRFLLSHGYVIPSEKARQIKIAITELEKVNAWICWYLLNEGGD